MSRLTDARQSLYDALSHVFDDPVDGLAFTAGRVHPYPPQTVAAPCVWIEQHRGGPIQIGERSTGIGVVFPVAIVYDGADRAQVAGLDELVGRVHDAAHLVGQPGDWSPQPVDVGGPTLRATFFDVEIRINAHTLCTPASLKEVV